MHKMPRAAAILLFIAVCVTMMVLLVLGGEPHRFLAEQAAERVFFDSHPGTPTSREFFTRNVCAGMSEKEVDKLLLPANAVLRHMPDRSATKSRWKGFINIYEYHYGRWQHPIFDISKELGVERVWVYFDEHGRAQKLYWSLSGEIAQHHPILQPIEIDLTENSVN